MKTLLPAGSILGAPKPKTLEIILEAKLMKEALYRSLRLF
jgi:para-aminobenzoate synthetase component 1